MPLSTRLALIVPVCLLCAYPPGVHPQAAESAPLSPRWRLTNPVVVIGQSLVLPIGRTATYYDPGYSLDLSAAADLRGRVGLQTSVGYTDMPVSTRGSVAIVAAGLGPRLSYCLTPRLDLSAFGLIGYHLAMISDGVGDTGRNLSVQTGIGATYRFGRFETGLQAVYGTDFDALARLSLGAQLGVALRRRGGLEVSEPQVEPLFPVLYRYYGEHPVGQVILANPGADRVSDISVSFSIDEYMDQPTQCPAPAELGPGERQVIDLYVLLGNRVLEVTEGDLVGGQVLIGYTVRGRQRTVARSVTVPLQGRNATQWDDDRKAAAYVTARHPEILNLARNAARWTETAGNQPIDRNLRHAIAVFEALRTLGIAYAPDPQTPYVTYSEDETAVDFLQFPMETLRYGVGDCDDLSILYAALLEGLGIETAFVTTPGHIFVAVRVAMSAKDLGSDLPLLEQKEARWAPIEVTRIRDPFLAAWSAGAELWRAAHEEGTAGFFTVRKAWEQYTPVDFRFSGSLITLPGQQAVVQSYETQYQRLGRQVVDSALDQLSRDRGTTDGRVSNRVGVLAARFGLVEDARILFEKAFRQGHQLVALLNLGNLRYIEGDYPGALEFYAQAETISPDDRRVKRSLERARVAQRTSSPPKGIASAPAQIELGSDRPVSPLRGAESEAEGDPWIID